MAAPGLEPAAAAELERLGFGRVREQRGGVLFEGSALRANRVLAIPTRVVERVARFKAHTFAQLEEGVKAVDWSRYGGLTPRATARASRLYHTGAIEQRLAKWVPAGEVELRCRIARNRCTLSVDTSGERLHRRGWRVEVGRAPLRETLAAGILELAGWAPGTPLYDPMCGSGTFLIEAALRAAGRPPGAERSFACEAWCAPEPLPEWTPVPTPIAGSDRNAGAVEVARRNAERAGVEIGFTAMPAAEATPPAETGLLVCNPPYGKRADRVEPAWAQLGALLSGPFAAWRAAVLCPQRALERHLGRPVAERVPLRNGGVRVDLLLLPPR